MCLVEAKGQEISGAGHEMGGEVAVQTKAEKRRPAGALSPKAAAPTHTDDQPNDCGPLRLTLGHDSLWKDPRAVGLDDLHPCRQLCSIGYKTYLPTSMCHGIALTLCQRWPWPIIKFSKGLADTIRFDSLPEMPPHRNTEYVECAVLFRAVFNARRFKLPGAWCRRRNSQARRTEGSKTPFLCSSS